MQEDDYTFVTLDSDDSMLGDVVVNVDDGNDLADIVMIDDNGDSSDFITLADDTVMLSDADTVDTYSMDMDSSDISFIL